MPTIPRAVLEHRAVLTLPDGTPFSEVVETYTAEVFAFPEPHYAPAPSSPLEGDGFELLVPRHKIRGFLQHSADARV